MSCQTFRQLNDSVRCSRLCPVPSKPHEVRCGQMQVLTGGFSPPLSSLCWAASSSKVLPPSTLQPGTYQSGQVSLPEQVCSSQAWKQTSYQGFLSDSFAAKRSIVYKPGTASTRVPPLQQSSPLPQFCVASPLTHQLQSSLSLTCHLPHTILTEILAVICGHFPQTNLAFLSLSFVNDDKKLGIPAENDFCHSGKFRTQGSANYDLNLSPSFSPPGIAQLE